MRIAPRILLLSGTLAAAVALAGCASSGASAGYAVAGSPTSSATSGPPTTEPASSSALAPSDTAIATGSPIPASVTPTPLPPTAAPTSAASSVPTTTNRVTVSEPANGSTIGVAPGTTVVVTLHNTYWQFRPVSAPKVLSQSEPTAHAVAPGRQSVPGSGQGTITETFHARTAGTAVITATRSTCGEAMRCTPAQSSYRITVTVR